ncbi:MAG TPA: hypothetical protein VLF91_05145 [Candidatus Saccharimonadales bacterium]|nr:hypothetical protein [Candidatus Saccharimonadales bacterium]
MLFVFLAGLVVAGCFFAAHRVFAMKKWSAGRKQFWGDGIGAIFALSLFLCLELLLQHTLGNSFYSLWRDGSMLPRELFIIGALQGIVYEYVGQFTYPLWYYPQGEVRRWMLLGLPLFWGVFMLIMQDTWALYRWLGAGTAVAFVLTALTQYGLIEGFNLITHSWKYKGWANTPYFLIIGWFILVLTFVCITNHVLGSPFGV